MAVHTHDGIDWVARLADLRRADDVYRPARRPVADRLIAALPAPRPTVLDVGCGAGGMSALFAAAVGERGGSVTLVDAVPELLAAATEATTAAAGAGTTVAAVRADLAEPGLAGRVPAADLVWASGVTHHLPDQRRMLDELVVCLAPGGCLALGEGGLAVRCLPWDVGLGEPGLADRLAAAHAGWFQRMRTEMPGSVRLPVGWNRAMSEAGLGDVTSFSYLVDLPAPLPVENRSMVVGWLDWIAREATDLLDPGDRAAVDRLLDEHDPAYVGRRDDVFVLSAGTVHTGWRR